LHYGERIKNIIDIKINPITQGEIIEEIYHIATQTSPPDEDTTKEELISYFDKLYLWTDKELDRAYKQGKKEYKRLGANQEEVDYSSSNFSDPFLSNLVTSSIYDTTLGEISIPNSTIVETLVDETSTEINDESDIYLGIFEELGIKEPNQD